MELKKCPFCGTYPVTEVDSVPTGMTDCLLKLSIRCEKCRFEIADVLKPTFAIDKLTVAIDKLADRWNRRAE